MESDIGSKSGFAVKAQQAERSLSVCYFGLWIVIRIELESRERPIAKLAAYALDYDKETKETPLIECPIDEGTTLSSTSEFFPSFLSKVLDAVEEKDLALRP
jgi:hypothetical protein